MATAKELQARIAKEIPWQGLAVKVLDEPFIDDNGKSGYQVKVKVPGAPFDMMVVVPSFNLSNDAVSNLVGGLFTDLEELRQQASH